MDKQRKTFLSYSRVNKDFAVRLARELKSEGLPVWLDQLDIPPGSRWDFEVEKALTECDIFMVIITKASSTSENVLDEIGYAIDNGKRMLPVLLEKTNVPLRLRRFQYVDFTDKSFDEGVQSAKDLLRTLIDQPTIPRKSVTEEPQATSALAETDLSAPGQTGSGEKPPSTSTAVLRREKMEQEMRFKEEEAKLLKEKDELAKELEKERSTKDRMPAVAAPPAKSRSRTIGIFGIAVVGILAVGFLATRFFMTPQRSTPEPTREIPTLKATEPLVPVTSPSETPRREEPTATEAAATEAKAAVETPTEDVTSTPAAPAAEITDGKGAAMVLVDAGEFLMGDSKGLVPEQPQHTVNLDAFYIDKFEVTNKLYQACVDEGVCQPPYQTYFSENSPGRDYYGSAAYENYPVVYVDWNMAKAYCEWRGARLPTEAEWEKAARGTEALKYPWGKDIACQNANYARCVNQTTEVGIYPDGVSPYGAFDMSGNVWEWVSDWYAENYYSNSPVNNPTGPISGQSRVVRGGAWNKDINNITTFRRSNWGATYNTWDIGIRCAGDLP